MIYKLVKWTNKKGKEVKRYDRLYGKHRKEEKRDDAEACHDTWNKLTIEQRWNELDKRPGKCTKERERLAKGIKAS